MTVGAAPPGDRPRRRRAGRIAAVAAVVAVLVAAFVRLRLDEAEGAWLSAGPDAIVALQDGPFVLSGRLEPDAPSGVATGWEQVSGPAPARIVGAPDLRTEVSADEPGPYVFRLVGTVDEDSFADEVAVRVVDVVMRADFEQDGIELGPWTMREHELAYPTTRGKASGVPDRTTLVDVPGFGRMIEAGVPAGEVGVGRTGMSAKFVLPRDDYDELWIEQTFRLRDDWPWSKGPEVGGKLGPGLYLGPSANGGCRPSDGGAAEVASGRPQAGSGGSVRIGWHTPEGAADFYVYYADMGGDPEVKGSECGIKFGWVRDDEGRVVAATPQNRFPEGNNYVHPVGETTTYTIHLRLNTGDEFDGAIDAFADGEHVGAVRNIRFRRAGLDWGIGLAAQNVYLGGHAEGHEFPTDTAYYAGPQLIYGSPPLDATEVVIPPPAEGPSPYDDIGDDDSDGD